MVYEKTKNGVVWTTDRETFQKFLDESHTFQEICEKLGLTSFAGANYKVITKRIREDNFNAEKFNQNRKTRRHKKKISYLTPNEEIFTENSATSSGVIKRRIRNLKLIDHICSECKIEKEWNGKPLTLQLDHINGVNNDNRIENLRFLCPNCHSQTDTFNRVKKKKKEQILKNCIKCGSQKKCNFGDLCRSCGCGSKLSKREKISKEELEKLIEKYSKTQIAKMYDVSHTAIKNWCKKYGIPPKPHGFWLRGIKPTV